MSEKPSFKKLEIVDLFSERVATFERQREDNDTVRISVGGEEFFCTCGSLCIAADVLNYKPQK